MSGSKLLVGKDLLSHEGKSYQPCISRETLYLKRWRALSGFLCLYYSRRAVTFYSPWRSGKPQSSSNHWGWARVFRTGTCMDGSLYQKTSCSRTRFQVKWGNREVACFSPHRGFRVRCRGFPWCMCPLDKPPSGGEGVVDQS